MTYTTITRKIELKVISEDNKSAWNTLINISNTTVKIANECMSKLYMREALLDDLIDSQLKPTEFKNLLNSKEKEDKNKVKLIKKNAEEKMKTLYSEEHNKSFYRTLALKYDGYPTNGIAYLVKMCKAKFSNQWIDLKIGKQSLITFKKGLPFYLKKNALDFSDALIINYNKDIKFIPYYGRDRSDNKSIVTNISLGKYEALDSTIQYDYDKNKFFLLLVVKIPKEEDVLLNEDLVMGVDLGLACAAVCSFNKGLKKLFINKDIIKSRIKIQKQRKSLQKNLKYTTGGRGRDKKLKALDKLKKSERNTVKNINHKISEEIVYFAFKNKAHLIRLEDLKGFKKDEWVLRNWSYYELQNMIENKAKKYGIKIEYITPAYTSQVCTVCGCKGERVNQETFICHNNKCKINKLNADLNASQNIAKGGVGITYNDEARSLFASLDYGQVVLPKTEDK